MKIEQLTCAIGAELIDVNLSEAIHNDDLFGTIREAWIEHKVLFARDQNLSDAEHAAFARRFGELEDHPLAKSIEDEPGIIKIYKKPHHPPVRYEASWHHDAPFRPEPPMGSVLKCVECPTVGGDTMWANMELAYDRLPDYYKELINNLKARHSFESTWGAQYDDEKRHEMHEQFPDAEHPIVRTHPETGRQCLYTGAFMTHITNYFNNDYTRVGNDWQPGANNLMNYLLSQATVPEYQVRWKWTPNSIAMWDNRCSQHYAVMDYPPCTRKMHRATIRGDKPF
jgi:taurine dioxygenase